MDTLSDVNRAFIFIEQHILVSVLLIILLILIVLFLFIIKVEKISKIIQTILEIPRDIIQFFQKKAPITPSYLPNKPDFFIGRDKQLKELHKLLKTSNSVALVNGIGGIGKTTIALEYIHNKKYNKNYRHIEWVTITSDIQSGFINNKFSDDIKFVYNTNKQPDENFTQLMVELNKVKGNNLLVIDNANDEPDILKNLDALKRTNWKLLFTSRCDIQEISAKIEIDVLKPDEARNLFLKYCPDIDNFSVLDLILKQIYYNTLVIELVAKTLKNHKSLNINTLSEKLLEGGIKNKDIQIEINTGAHAIMTNNEKKARINEYIQRIFDLTTMSETDQKYLLYSSILPSVEIHIEDLKIIFNILEESELAFIESLNHSVNNGWLQEKSKTYKMHPLIKAVIQEKLEPNADNCKDIIINIAYLFICEPNESLISRKELVPFAESIWNSVYNEKNKQQFLTNELGALANNLAEINRALGNYEKSLDLHMKSITIRKKLFLEDSLEIAISYGNIALIYSDLDNHEKALEYQILDLSIREKILAPEDISLASSYGNIALTYLYLGDFEKALEYQMKDIAILEKALDQDHPYIASAYNNLSLTYQYLKQYEKALEYQNIAIIIGENNLIKNHPDLATYYGNIALIYNYMENYKLALEYQKKDIAIKEEILDKNHPNLATSYNNIASIYYYLQDYKKAKYYIDKAVEIRRLALPINHSKLNESLEGQKDIYNAIKEKKKNWNLCILLK